MENIRTDSWRFDLLAIIFLAIFWLAFFWSYLTPVERDRLYLAPGDFTGQFYVTRGLALRELRQGRFPLWEPCIYSGYPLHADPQSALFYPLTQANVGIAWITGQPEIPLFALEIESLVHILLASFFLYTFLRAEVGSHWAALLGSMAFCYGGFLTGYPVLQVAILETAMWLPLALLGTHFFFLRRQAWSGLLTSFALALAVLAGHPQTAMFVFYTVLAYAVFSAWRARSGWRALGVYLGLSYGFALGLSAIQILPSLEFTALSSRAHLSLEEAGSGFPFTDVIQFLVIGAVSFWQPLYVGILPLTLALAAVFLWRSAPVFFWFTVALIALGLSFGHRLFLFDLAYTLLPGYNLFRGQERHAFLVSFALSTLGAHGAAAFLSLDGWPRDRLRRLAVVCWAGVVLLGAAYFGFVLNRAATADDPLAIRLGWATVLLAFTGTLFIWWIYSAPGPAMVLGMLALLGTDVFISNRGVNDSAPYPLYPPPPILEPLRGDKGLFRVQDDSRLPGGTLCMHGLKDVRGMPPLQIAAYRDFQERVREGVRWKLLAVKYLVTWRGQAISFQGEPVEATTLYREEEGSQANYLYRLEPPPRWAWVVRDIRVAQDADQLYALLNAPDFDPWQTAVVAEPLSYDAVSMGGEDRVRIESYSPQRIEVSAHLAAPGLLMLSEVTYPGWRAQVDGREVPIYQADGILRAIPLEAGEYHVVLTYEPTSFRLGLLLSATTLAGLGVGGVVWIRRRRSDRA